MTYPHRTLRMPLLLAGVLSVAPLIAVIVRLGCLGSGWRLCAAVVGRRTAQLLMRMAGIEMQVHGQEIHSPPPDRRAIPANHTSTLDMFILRALGLPRARFMKRRDAKTEDWRLDELLRHTDKVRSLYLGWCGQLQEGAA